MIDIFLPTRTINMTLLKTAQFTINILIMFEGILAIVMYLR